MNNSTFAPAQLLALEKYIELLRLKNYSENTISVYRNWFSIFLKNFPEKKPSTITKDEVMEFIFELKNKTGLSATSQNQLISSVKFFYEAVLKREKEIYDLPRAQKPFQLPKIFYHLANNNKAMYAI